MHDLETTLVAPATPQGRGGVACVRLSGPDAAAIGLALFRPRARKPEPGGPPAFGHFVAGNGKRLDHGYLVLFAERASFTGETTAEAWVHGSPVVVEELVRTAVAAGAKLAEPGEFSYRAVRRGRLDLTRAEAIRDLVAARTHAQARIALEQAEGSVSRMLQPLRETLEEWIARTEAAIEFVDEAETNLGAHRFLDGLTETLGLCDELLRGFERGRIVREGARVAIVGRPNVGKSSLFNQLLGHDRAIVTDVPGTTRDTLGEAIDLDGIPVCLIDTAGLRDVEDRVEREGVERAHMARAEADLVLLVLDGSRAIEPDERVALSEADPVRTLLVSNKSDLPAPADLDREVTRLVVSARTGSGIERLRDEIRHRLAGDAAPIEAPAITNARHAAALEATRDAILAALAAVRSGLSEEAAVVDLRDAAKHLGTITGEVTNEALYDRIFSTFCIGK